MCPQVRHGVSADGQMIGVTGLLPISEGATCRLYNTNVYPNYAHLYTSSAIINPCKGTWNQEQMTKCYQFDTLIETSKNGGLMLKYLITLLHSQKKHLLSAY